MMEMPRPVLMVSSLTTEGAEATLKALDLGAVDFIPKQLSKVSLDIIKIEQDLLAKVKTMAKRRVQPLGRSRLLSMDRGEAPSGTLVRPEGGAAGHGLAGSLARPEAAVSRPLGRQVRDVVAVGVSTGGPPAVQRILSALPEDFPAGILIAQHMPAAFTGPFAKRLDGVCKIQVKEAESGDQLKPGHAFVAPGGKHVIVDPKTSRIDLVVTPEPKEALYKPSANVLIGSVGEHLGRRALGVILTGMGNDGMEGVRILKQKGGRALAQSDATCVVYGMPQGHRRRRPGRRHRGYRRHGRGHHRDERLQELTEPRKGEGRRRDTRPRRNHGRGWG